MDKQEAREILHEQITQLRTRGYDDLRASLLNTPEAFEISGQSGAIYQVEIQTHWDSGKDGPLRVFAFIDDGGWRSFAPMSESFILALDGSFVGE